MNAINIILQILLLLAGIFLVVAVLLQRAKGKGLSGAIAGGVDTFFGKEQGPKVDRLLNRLTIIVAIVVDIDEILGIDFGIAIMVSSFISCILFQGFAEIIDLLQKNVAKQESILNYLKDKATKEYTAPKSLIEDIEANLPDM